MANKHINVGVGFSKEKDSYKAVQSAVKQALKPLKGKTPNLSLIFYAGKDYDAKEINKGLKELLKGTEFVGGSTDAVIFKEGLYPEGIVVASLQSDYIHFGVSSIENVTKNPKELAKKAITEAVKKIKLDSYVDSYMAFSRVKKGDITELIRIPSFFVYTFTRGYKPDKMGNEDLIIDGIGEQIGKYIPIFGGSLGSDMDNVFNNTPYEIVSFHSGKIMKDGLITVFAHTDLKYACSIAHGGVTHGKMGYISKIEEHGFVVSKINDQPVIDWYAKQVGVSKKLFLSKLLYYTQKFPLGFPDGYGNIIMRAGGVPHPKGLAYIAPFRENTPVWMMNIDDKKNLKKTNEEITSDISNHIHKKIIPEFSFLVSCSSRRRIIDHKIYLKEINNFSKRCKIPLFGFCSFGEIGCKSAEACHFHHLSNDLFDLYGELLSK
jgi:hypothetical protein